MKNITLLYAEDEEQTRLNYTKLFLRDFKEVYSCINGKEAYEEYLKYKPNILLLDINMPKINGLELAKKIRLTDKLCRIIILTAHLEQDKLLLATELNLTKYLAKPISRKDLKDALELAFTQYKELHEINSIINIDENYTWDKVNNVLFKNKIQIKLTKNETLLIQLLISQINNVFSISQISYHLWQDIYDEEKDVKKIKDIIKRLRKKIQKESITNIYGLGYKLKVL